MIVSSENCTDANSSSVGTPIRIGAGVQEAQWSDCRGFAPAVYKFTSTNARITSNFDVSEESSYCDDFQQFFNGSVMDTCHSHKRLIFCTRMAA